ncbi:MAG: hypothetical protein AAFN12_00815 [Cyanobacteria bacterium J06560_2]
MSYNAVTDISSPQSAHTQPTPATGMTNDELQAAVVANTAAIDKLTGAVDVLVDRFIRPNAQQHLESMDRLGRIEQILERHAEAIATIDLKLDRIADQQTTSAQQIAANTEAITQFDTRLEETRQLVAKNASDIAQMGTRHDRMFERLDARLEQITDKQDANANQIEALAELSRTQLAAIVGNSRRIDRLEQQAS